jgi:hypothetical protein
MNEEPSAVPEHQTTARAEELLDRLGHRFQDVRASVGRALEQRAHRPANGEGEGGSDRPAAGRAQETLGTWGERVGFVAGAAGLRLRQWGARAREEAEDLWAEAQTMRQQSGAKQSGASAAASGAPDGASSTTSVGYEAAELPHDFATEADQGDASAQPL